MRVRTDTYLRIREQAPRVTCAAAAVLVVSMFLGWFRSGSRMRNSFEMFRIPQQLGLDGFTGIRVVWFLVPVMAVAVLGMVLLERRVLAAGVAAVMSLVGLVVGAIVLFSPLDTGLGSLLAVVAGLTGFAGAGLLAITARPPE